MTAEWTWLTTHWFSLLQTVSIVSSLCVVAKQQHDANRQRESEAMLKLYDINRQLITLGFSHPELFDVMEDEHIQNSLFEKRYLQLWLNQLAVSHAFLKRAVSQREFKEELRRNLEDFISMKLMQNHWQHHFMFYTDSFQRRVNGILSKDEPPKKTAHPWQWLKDHAAKTWRAIFSKTARGIRTKDSPVGAVKTAPSDGAGV